MRLAWSSAAQAELREIRRYSDKRWGNRIATEYLLAIRSGVERAAAEPERLRPLKEGFLQLRVRSHILVMQIDRDANELLILRVLHASMDIDARLPKPADDQSLDSFD